MRSCHHPRGKLRVALAALLTTLALSSAAYAAEVTDQRGHTITLGKPAERVVFIPIPAPSTFITIDGSARHVVGMNSYSASAMREGIFGKLFPETAGITTSVVMAGADPSNFTPNVEAILALQPDVVFQWTSSAKDFISVLDRTGISVLGMRVGSLENFAEYVKLMGKVAGKQERANTLLARQDAVKQRLRSELRSIEPAQRPRVLYFNRMVNMLRVSGKGSFNDFYIRLAGGQNAAADNPQLSTITLEQVLAWNPQVILLGNFDAALPSDLYGDPRWQSVDAVKNHRVYRMPLGGYRWDPPSHESALGWIWLAGLLQPEREHTDLRKAMREWFVFLYNHQLTDDEIDGILFVKENRASAGYERYSAR